METNYLMFLMLVKIVFQLYGLVGSAEPYKADGITRRQSVHIASGTPSVFENEKLSIFNLI